MRKWLFFWPVNKTKITGESFTRTYYFSLFSLKNIMLNLNWSHALKKHAMITNDVWHVSGAKFGLASQKPIKVFRSHRDDLIQYNNHYMLNNIITLKPGWKFEVVKVPPPFFFFCTILLCIVWQELGWVHLTSWLETIVLAWVQNAMLIIIQFSSLQKWSVRFRCSLQSLSLPFFPSPVPPLMSAIPWPSAMLDGCLETNNWSVTGEVQHCLKSFFNSNSWIDSGPTVNQSPVS